MTASPEQAHDLFLRGHNGEARRLARRALDDARRRHDPLAAAEAEALLGMVAYDELAYDEALAHLDRAVADFARAAGPHSLATLHAVGERAVAVIALERRGEYAGIVATLRANLPRLGAPMERRAAEAWAAVALLEEELGHHHDAVETLHGVLAALGDDAPASLRATVLLHLSGAQQRSGDAASSLASLQRSVALRVEAFGEENLRVADARLGVARALLTLNRPAEALAEARAAMATLKRLGQDRRPRSSTAWTTLGLALLQAEDDMAGASEHFEHAAAIEERTFGGAHVATARMLAMTAAVHALRGNHARVAALLGRALPTLEKARDPGLYEATNRYTTALTATGRHRAAADYAQQRLAKAQGRLPAAMIAAYEWAIGQSLLLDKKTKQAEVHLRRARDAAAGHHGPDSEFVRDLEHSLAMLSSGARPVPKWIA